MVAKPTNERQARELAKLPADEQADAWAVAVETAPLSSDGTPKVMASLAVNGRQIRQ